MKREKTYLILNEAFAELTSTWISLPRPSHGNSRRGNPGVCSIYAIGLARDSKSRYMDMEFYFMIELYV